MFFVQETKEEIVHDVGAGIFFVLGNVYAWLQVNVSYKMKRFGKLSSSVCTMRTLVSVLSTISLPVFIIMKFYSERLWDGNELFWHANDPGYTIHVVGNVFEWLMVFSFLILILTFTKELSRYRLEVKIVGYRDDYEPIPVST